MTRDQGLALVLVLLKHKQLTVLHCVEVIARLDELIDDIFLSGRAQNQLSNHGMVINKAAECPHISLFSDNNSLDISLRLLVVASISQCALCWLFHSCSERAIVCELQFFFYC